MSTRAQKDGTTLTVPKALEAAVSALGGEHRPGQLQMAMAVADTFDGGDHLLVQAGTGTGKSLGYLVPAILHAVNNDKKVVVATATLALQYQLVERDLPAVVKALAPLLKREPTFAVHKGRHNYVCLDKLNRAAPEDEDDHALFSTPSTPLGRQAKRVRDWAQTTRTGDKDDYPGELDPRIWRGISVDRRECVGPSKCAFGIECFVEAARDEAREADIIVTNHAMLAIHVIEQPVLPEHDCVVVDEGHEMVDRFTGTSTQELNVSDVQKAASRLRKEIEPIYIERLEDAAALLEVELEFLADGEPGPKRIESVGGSFLIALTSIRDASHAALTALNANKDKSEDPDVTAAKQRARAAVEHVHDVAGKMLSLTEFDVAWLDAGRTPTLRIAPLSIAGLAREGLFKKTKVVMTSATLTLGGSFDPVANQVGLKTGPNAKGWIGLDVGSPFDHAKQGILYCPSHLPAPTRDGVTTQALDELVDLLIAAGGRTLALFSSWRGVEKAQEHLEARLKEARLDDELPLMVQKKGDRVGDLVQKFADNEKSSLLGTMSLWQGVDVPGRSCTLVVIDRIPFPRPDEPVMAARARKVDEEGGSGFAQVSVPKAALLLAQGVGRLIRSQDDKGVVAILDSRFATARYGKFLKDSLPPFWFTTDREPVKSALSRLAEQQG